MSAHYIQKKIGKTENVTLDPWNTTHPLIHRIEDYTSDDGPVTVCGRQLAPWAPVLRSDHAHKIGRRCKRCFRGF